ncbi:MAG: phosphatidylglycerol lysyltransferase domain-containing protein [Thermodesulfobacteriota bacterium]
MSPQPFHPISLRDRSRYESFFNRCPQKASDYSFVNLWGWRTIYGLSLAWNDDLVWIRQEVPQPMQWAPIGDWETVDWEKRIAMHPEYFEQPTIRVPERLATIWSRCFGERIQVTESREHWDYVYAAQHLRELKGNKYHKKKNLLSQFLKSYDFVYEPMSEALVEEALSLQEDWCTWKSCEESESLSGENEVITEILRNWNALGNLIGGMVRMAGKPAAYTIGEVMDPATIVVHVEKGHPDYRGIYQAINWLFVSRLPESILWVNREQDLGDEGLRKAKLSYHPAAFVKKFNCRMILS